VSSRGGHGSLLANLITTGTDQSRMALKRKLLNTAPLQGDEAAAAICAVIRRIPKGWVATYGQVAAIAGLPRRARLVGRVLHDLGPTTDIPWHRVVNANGAVSCSPSRNGGDALQRRLLEREGVEFDDRDRFDLERFRWPE
jgi:methylated-DNA-protein-cysteine methyltransferase-like protein